MTRDVTARREYYRLYMREYNAKKNAHKPIRLCAVCQDRPVRYPTAKTCTEQSCQEKYARESRNAQCSKYNKKRRLEAKAGKTCADCPADISHMSALAKRCPECARKIKLKRLAEKEKAMPKRTKIVPLCCICRENPVSRLGAKVCRDPECAKKRRADIDKVIYENRKSGAKPVKKSLSGRTTDENIEYLGQINDLRREGRHAEADAMKAKYFPEWS